MPPQPAARADLMAYLAQLGITTTSVEHTAVFTVAESDAIERDLPGGHTKNLFLRDAKGQLFLIVAEAHTKVDLKALYKKLGCARLSFGSPDLLMTALGVTPGSVTAFAVLNDLNGQVRVVLDRALLAYDVINCHPLTNTATTSISREDLLRFFQATGHDATVLSLDSAQ